MNNSQQVSEIQAMIYHTVFLGLALIVIPAAYIALCGWMRSRRVHRLSYLAHFFLFGALGGWCLALGFSPSGITAACTVFLVVTSPVCLITSLFLQFRQDRNPFDSVAMLGGYVYTLLLVVAAAFAASVENFS